MNQMVCNSMIEPVRFVIWDLDETFWKGTLTEGGISEYVRAHHDMVIELANRGIISSICSKNDHDTVRAILEKEGIWDYFILPSISWEPKGPRIAALIEAIQLRPPTIMFIDDNPMNLEEARHMAPGLQVQSHEFIPHILSHPLFKGKDDTALKRLKQYKMLEKRKADEAHSGADINAFLRSSNIRVRFDYDLHANIDRAVELINRTNQLNFTKTRLPENTGEARRALLDQIASHEIRVALVGVRDNYGDHGWCGLYMLHNNGSLIHYAFSCRILGMQVETWLYNKLGRPRLNVQGEVLTDVKRTDIEVDWVQIDTGDDKVDAASQLLVDHVIARGGCDLMPVAHYFGTIAKTVTGEFNDNRWGMDGRIDHSTFLAAAVAGTMTDPAIEAATRIGYRSQDFQSGITSSRTGSGVWLLSFWTDAAYVLYKHREFGFTVPFSLSGYHIRDARMADISVLRESGVREDILSALQVLKDDYDYIGFIAETDFKTNMTTIFHAAPEGTKVFVVTPNEYFVSKDHMGQIMPSTRQQTIWTKEVARAFPNVSLLNIRDYIASEDEVHSPYHFDRMVYFRLFNDIKTAIAGGQTAAASTWAIHERDDLDAALLEEWSAHALSRTAKFLLDAGQPGPAVEFANRAVQQAPGVLTHRLILLEAYGASHHDLDESEVEQLVGDDSLPPVVLHRIGNLLFDKGRFNEAASLFGRAAEAEPAVFSHRHRQANAFDRAGRAEEAYTVFKDCFDAGDRNPHVMAHMARLLIGAGRYSNAEVFLGTCLVMDPEFPPFLSALANLKSAQKSAGLQPA